MHISNIFIEGFRIFGSEKDGEHLDLNLKPGLNVLVGENDSGKTAIVDAIRIVLQTSSFDYYRLTEDDFHLQGSDVSDEESEESESEASSKQVPSNDLRATEFTIRCMFSDLGTPEVGKYLEWLSVDDEGKPALYITFRAQRRTDSPEGQRRNRFPYTVHSGSSGDGPRIEGEVREFLRVTYLKPLRDAEAELTAGRGSRLSQILERHPDFSSQRISDFDPEGEEDHVPETLLGIFRQAEHRITENSVISDTQATLNDRYLNELALGEEALRGQIGVSRETELRQILEKLELWLEPDSIMSPGRTRRGLGYNNILFMATELLLLGDTSAESFPMLLVEEPEAHLHPQMQLRLMAFLERKSKAQGDEEQGDSTGAAEEQDEDSEEIRTDDEGAPAQENTSTYVVEEGSAQIILTTHSPNLASKARLSSMILMCRGQAFPLDNDHTRLDAADYRFLERFLDVTKANLFFAKGVLFVEGDAENILLPVLASLLRRPFSKYGISVVNVGHTGFFRYARILQSKPDVTEVEVPIPVACIADRDIVPDEAADSEEGGYVRQRKTRRGEKTPTFRKQFSEKLIKEREASKKKADGAKVETFVSPSWTLEHDLAESGLAVEIHAAVKAAKKEEYQDEQYGAIITPETLSECIEEARNEVDSWRKDNKTARQIAVCVYEDLHKGNASKAVAAQMLAQILTDQKPSSSELAAKLPSYIIDAIEHLTGPGISSKNHASQNQD